MENRADLMAETRTSYFLQELVSLRSEILQSQWFLVGCSLIVLVLMLFWSNITNDSKISLIGAALPYVLARFDYLIHRAGLFIKNVGSMWENSQERRKKVWILVVADIGCLLPILGMWCYSEYQNYLAGNTALVLGTMFQMVAGITTFVIAASSVSNE